MNIENVNVKKLLDEFTANSIVWTNAKNNLNHDENEYIGTVNVMFEDGTDMDLVQQIIDNHDPTPLPPLPKKEEILERELANTNAMILELTELIIGGM